MRNSSRGNGPTAGPPMGGAQAGGCQCGVVMNGSSATNAPRARSGVNVAKNEFPWQVQGHGSPLLF